MHKDIIDKREGASATYIDRKNSDLQSPFTMRAKENRFNNPKTFIARVLAAIYSNMVVEKRGKPENKTTEIYTKTIKK